jgi:hypothetical protein
VSDSPFAPEQTRKHVEAALGIIPADARRVCLAYARSDGTVQLAYVERVGPHWTIGAIVGHAPDAGWTGEVAVRGVW